MLGLVKMIGLGGRKPAQLSGGQQQRVALARALANHPKVLLLDEPLSALDLKLRQEMRSELKSLQRRTGITFIFVTHDQDEALTMSDRVAVMNKGRILQIGAPRDIYDHPAERFVANFIGDTNFIEADVVTTSNDGAKVKLDSGAMVSASLPPGATASGRVTLVVRPEHTRLAVPADGAPLSGRIENVVYFGTDTHYHIRLPRGPEFIVRMQNTRDRGATFEPGQIVGIDIGENAAQILKD
jgi:spermidine/putrescine transport system ATP-binding protein